MKRESVKMTVYNSFLWRYRGVIRSAVLCTDPPVLSVVVLMSSYKKAAPKPKDGEKEVKKVIQANALGLMLHLLRGGKIHFLAVFCMAVTACLLFNSSGGGSLALLYIFALDGKFSGRMDGNVLMRNGRGRAFAYPAVVRNGNTMTARGIFSIQSSTYASLTAAQVEAWRGFSINITNRFGQAKTIKGKECFIAINVNLTLVGGTVLTDPPVFVGVPAIETGALTATSPGTVALAFTPTPTNANVAHLIFATKPLGNGITRPSQSAFRFIDIIGTTTTSPASIGAAYVTRFGNFVAGQKIFVQLTGVDVNTGQSTPSIGTSAVTT